MNPRIKSILKYSGSVYLTQILNIIYIFILPRFLEPVMLGKFNLLQTFYSYLTFSHIGIAFGLDKEIPFHIEKKEQDKIYNTANIGITSILVATVAIDIIILVSISLFSSLIDKDIYRGLFLICASIIFYQAINCIRILVRAHEEISKMSRLTLSYGFLWAFFRLIGSVVYGFYGLLLGMLISNILGLIISYKIGTVKFKYNFDFNKIMFLFKAGFPFFIYFILLIFFGSMDKLIITWFLGFKELGYYSIGSLIVNFLLMLPYSINEVIFPGLLKKISANQDKSIILNYLKNYMLISSKLFVIVIGSLIIFLPFLVTFYIPKYLSGIASAQILILSCYPMIFQNLYVYYLYGTGKHKLFIYPPIIGIGFFTFGTTILWILHSISLLLIATLMTVSTFLFCYITMYFTLKELEITSKEMLLSFIKSVLPLFTILVIPIISGLFIIDKNNILQNFLLTFLTEVIFIISTIPLLLNIKKYFIPDQREKIKMAVIVLIPTPIRDNLFKLFTEKLGYENLKVFYCDKTTKTNFQWNLDKDRPFQEKFLYKLTPNFIDKLPFVGYLNPNIISELNSFKPDSLIIYGYTNATSILAIMWAKFNKIPYIMTGVMELASIEKKKGVARFIRDSIIKFIFKGASSILSVGTSCDKWCEHFGIPQDKIIRASYSNDNEFYFKESKLTQSAKAELRKKYNIPENNIVFISVSRLIAVKQIDKLIITFKELEQKYKNISLLIVGNGEQEAYLKDKAKDSVNIIFTGGVQKPELAKLYGISDCFILNSNYEPWGLVLNEAMACSLPIITTNIVGSHFDLVKDNENGFVIDYGENNQIELFKAMEKIINTKNLDNFRINSLNIILKWSYNETIEGFLKAINKLTVK